jgi:hypothetical protein
MTSKLNSPNVQCKIPNTRLSEIQSVSDMNVDNHYTFVFCTFTKNTKVYFDFTERILYTVTFILKSAIEIPTMK